jgi:hypothetical protein
MIHEQFCLLKSRIRRELHSDVGFAASGKMCHQKHRGLNVAQLLFAVRVKLLPSGT